ncbi:unnamed protein product [Adineta ricciae]|uniref:RNA helicase n=1 Tax=Adineta ricciae TaxID=249248 RepID=A0A815KN82_ADIRI|nr:unnamed protein product [Adineta ricciae]CAF1395799.1 unnamed protein product [Adineta ricciae]
MQSETKSSSVNENFEKFDELNLNESLLRGIYQYGFDSPLEIQRRSLRSCLSGRDVMIQCESYSGKTITSLITVLQRIDVNCKDCQALIVVLTRDLAQSIYEIIVSLGQLMTLSCHCCIGGVQIREDTKALEKNVQIVVGTPARISDLLRRSILKNDQIRIVVFDNLDEIISYGFQKEIYEIIVALPNAFQSIVLLNTMSEELTKLTEKFLNDPVNILPEKKELTFENIQQYYVNVEREEWKFETLLDLLNLITTDQIILFCNSNEKIDWLSEKLREVNYKVSPLYRKMNSKERNESIKDFRRNLTRILIRTDLNENQMNIFQVNLLINYDLPTSLTQYQNRIGFSDEFHRKRILINFIINNENEMLNEFRQFYGISIEQLPLNVLS